MQRQRLITAAKAEARAVYPEASDDSIAAQAVLLLSRRAMISRGPQRDLYESAAMQAQIEVRLRTDEVACG